MPVREAESASALRGFRQVLGAWMPCLLSEMDFCRSILDGCERPGTSDQLLPISWYGLATDMHSLTAVGSQSACPGLG